MMVKVPRQKKAQALRIIHRVGHYYAQGPHSKFFVSQKTLRALHSRGVSLEVLNSLHIRWLRSQNHNSQIG